MNVGRICHIHSSPNEHCYRINLHGPNISISKVRDP